MLGWKKTGILFSGASVGVGAGGAAGAGGAGGAAGGGGLTLWITAVGPPPAGRPCSVSTFGLPRFVSLASPETFTATFTRANSGCSVTTAQLGPDAVPRHWHAP